MPANAKSYEADAHSPGISSKTAAGIDVFLTQPKQSPKLSSPIIAQENVLLAKDSRKAGSMKQKKVQQGAAHAGDDSGYYADEDDTNESDSEDDEDSDSSVSSEGPPRSIVPDRPTNRCRHASSRTFMHVGDSEAFSPTESAFSDIGSGPGFTSTEDDDGGTDK